MPALGKYCVPFVELSPPGELNAVMHPGGKSDPKPLERRPRFRPTGDADRYVCYVPQPITVSIAGGLGNQLFRYYAAFSLAALRGTGLVLDDT